MLEALTQHCQNHAATEDVTTQQNTLRTEIERKAQLAAALYPDWKSGILTYDEYSYAKEKYSREIADLKQCLAEIASRHLDPPDPLSHTSHWVKLMDTHRATVSVTPELVNAFVQSIQLNREGGLDIEFLFAPDQAALDAEIRRIKKEVA